MNKDFNEHYKQVNPLIKKRLLEFEAFLDYDDKKIFEEMTYCIFAANSSAKMADAALKLLKPILWTGTLEEYQNTVYKKVRFYNIRSKYLHENRNRIQQLGGLKIHLNDKTPFERRQFIKDNFKGFGLKESSHFLRNIGYRGYCIIDKHVLSLMHDFGVIDTKDAPKNDKRYFEIENKIIEFAKQNNYDLDELDLALWSFKSGSVMR